MTIHRHTPECYRDGCVYGMQAGAMRVSSLEQDLKTKVQQLEQALLDVWEIVEGNLWDELDEQILSILRRNGVIFSPKEWKE